MCQFLFKKIILKKNATLFFFVSQKTILDRTNNRPAFERPNNNISTEHTIAIVSVPTCNLAFNPEQTVKMCEITPRFL